MKELIKIKEEDGKQLVSARELHKFLGASERFLNWMDRQFQYGFEESQDYVGCKEFNTQANQELIDYAMTLDMAKEISMIQRSEKGKEARQYFIACEKKLKDSVKPMSMLEMIAFQALEMDRQNKAILNVESKVLEIESKIITKDESFYTVSGYANLVRLKLDNTTANKLGRQASILSKQLSYPKGKAFDAKYGEIGTYHKDILKMVFKN